MAVGRRVGGHSGRAPMRRGSQEAIPGFLDSFKCPLQSLLSVNSVFPVNLTIFPTEKAVARRAHKSDLQSVNMSLSSSDIGPNQVTGS